MSQGRPLAAELGKENVLAGLCRNMALVAAPGHIHYIEADPFIAFGELDNRINASEIDLIAGDFLQQTLTGEAEYPGSSGTVAPGLLQCFRNPVFFDPFRIFT